MNAMDHVSRLPWLVINVPTSTEKLEQFMLKTRPLYSPGYVFPASPIVDARTEAFEWRDMVRESKTHSHLYDRVNVFLAQDKTLEREAKQLEYAKTYSLYRTTISALKFGLEQGWERFMIFEDDAVPRLDVLLDLEAPPADAELTVWGGAIPMGAHNHDDQQYLAGRRSAYKRITNPVNRYIATAYEVTQRAAEEQLRSLSNHPHAIDCAWWYTMESVVSYSISPTAFVQVGQSDRIDKLKEGKYQR